MQVPSIKNTTMPPTNPHTHPATWHWAGRTPLSQYCSGDRQSLSSRQKLDMQARGDKRITNRVNMT